MNIADESFPEVLLSDSSDEELRKSFPGPTRPTHEEDTLKKRSKSHDELNQIGFRTRRSSNYQHVPSKVKQYISSLPKPNHGRRLVKQQTMPEMGMLKEEMERESLKSLREMTSKYEESQERLKQLMSCNDELRQTIEEMKQEAETVKETVSEVAIWNAWDTVNLQEPESGLRKRFVEPQEEAEHLQEGSLRKCRRGKRHKIRKVLKKLICCSGSDSLTLNDGYMELPAAQESTFYSHTQVAY